MCATSHIGIAVARSRRRAEGKRVQRAADQGGAAATRQRRRRRVKLSQRLPPQAQVLRALLGPVLPVVAHRLHRLREGIPPAGYAGGVGQRASSALPRRGRGANRLVGEVPTNNGAAVVAARADGLGRPCVVIGWHVFVTVHVAGAVGGVGGQSLAQGMPPLREEPRVARRGGRVRAAASVRRRAVHVLRRRAAGQGEGGAAELQHLPLAQQGIGCRGVLRERPLADQVHRGWRGGHGTVLGIAGIVLIRWRHHFRGNLRFFSIATCDDLDDRVANRALPRNL
mmetsp:Transcript_25796/g.71890  ORF Transcript_25796/g.71890 Transcript_25796/m.71890 type:complete len:283 (+) Transcript_25796:746-1594(+)